MSKTENNITLRNDDSHEANKTRHYTTQVRCHASWHSSVKDKL